MIKAAIRDSLIYGAAGLVTRAVGLLLLPLYSRLLSPGDYGVLEMILVVASVASIAVPLEISLGLARHYPDADNEHDKRQYALTAWLFTLGMYGLFTVLVFLQQALLPVALLDAVPATIYRMGMAFVILIGLLSFLQNQLRWELKGRGYAAVTLLNSVGGGALSAVFGWYFGLMGVIAGLLGGLLLAIVLASLLLKHNLAGSLSAGKLYKMLGYSLPLVPASLSAIATIYADRLLLGYFSGVDDVGLFALGYRVASIATLGLIGIQGALTPLISSHHREAQTPADIAKLFHWFVAISIGICGFLGLFSHEIVWIMASASFADASKIVAILSPACVMMQLYIFFPGMFLAKKTWLQLGVQLTAAVANIGLALWLIPKYGFTGAALANLISSLLFCLVWARASQIYYRVPFNKPAVLGGVALYASIIAVGTELLPSWHWLGVVLKFVLLLTLGGGVLWIGLVRTEEIYALFRRLRLRLRSGV